MEIQSVRVSQPTGILELLALDGDFDRIVATRPRSLVEPAEAARLDATGRDRILGLRRGVQRSISIDKNIAEVLPVDRNDRFPLHVGGDIDLVGNGTLARAGVAGVDHDVGIHLALPRVRSEVHEVDAEVETAVAAREIAAIAEGERKNVARGIGVVI